MYLGRTLALIAGLWLPSCGVTYLSPTVSGENTDVDVSVVEIGPATISAANSAPYVPRSLPAAFSMVAGGGSPRGAGAVPLPPALPDAEPGALALRLPPPVESGAYELGTGDVLRLTLGGAAGAESLVGGGAGGRVSQSYTVRGDGTVSLPEVGPVRVAGMGLEEAESRLFQRFVEAGLDPTFGLEVQEFGSRRITVGGDVRAAAIVPVGFVAPTIEEALAAAGGVAVTDRRYASIRIYRDGALYQIPLSDYRDRPELRRLTLAGGDQVFVDSAYDLDRALAYYESQIRLLELRRGARDAALGALAQEIGLRRAELQERRGVFEAREALGANARDYVYLAGEVTQQGRWALPYDGRASLADALFGGSGYPLETGNSAQIYVIRAGGYPGGAGTVTAWRLDGSNAINLAFATAFEMRPNDIVFVEEQPSTRFQRASSQLVPDVLTIVNSVSN